MAFRTREAYRAYHRGWRSRDPKRIARQKANDAARHANARAARFGVPGTLSAVEVEALFASSTACHYCGASGSLLGLDHVIPMAKGGPNTLANVVVACHSCNQSKQNHDAPGAWGGPGDRCLQCDRSDRPHAARGLCRTCYAAKRKQGFSDRRPGGRKPQAASLEIYRTQGP